MYIFGAEDLMTALGLTAADWEIQSADTDRQQDWAGTESNVGAHIAAAEVSHNDRSDISVELKLKNPAGSSVAFTLGGIGTGAATEAIVVTAYTAKEVYNDNGTLSLTAHRHETVEDVDGHVAAHMATPVSQAVALELGFGITEVLLGGALKNCQSKEVSASVKHDDKFSNRGRFLTGNSTGLRYECTEEYVDEGAITVPAPWKQDSQPKKTSKDGLVTRSVKAHAFSLA